MISQSVTVLPDPPIHIVKQIQDIFFNFLWNNKVDKVKRNTVIGNYEDGGLKMPILPLCQIGCDKISSGAVEESSLTDAHTLIKIFQNGLNFALSNFKAF
jgi:hypothetical protein